MQIIALSRQSFENLSNEAELLNKKVSFAIYLLEQGYKPLSARLFLKDDPLELIRLTRKDGLTMYKNFAQKEDKGTFIDFLRNRSLEEGRIIPNQKMRSFNAAVEKANAFIARNPIGRNQRAVVRRIACLSGNRMGYIPYCV